MKKGISFQKPTVWLFILSSVCTKPLIKNSLLSYYIVEIAVKKFEA
jgi:hypothetical protein